ILLVETELGELGADRRAVDVLHYHVVELTLRVEVEIVDLDDVRVAQLRNAARFTLEALLEFGVLAEKRMKDLNSNVPVQCRMVGPVDLGHAAPPDTLAQLRLAQRFAYQIFSHNCLKNTLMCVDSGPRARYASLCGACR